MLIRITFSSSEPDPKVTIRRLNEYIGKLKTEKTALKVETDRLQSKHLYCLSNISTDSNHFKKHYRFNQDSFKKPVKVLTLAKVTNT